MILSEITENSTSNIKILNFVEICRRLPGTVVVLAFKGCSKKSLNLVFTKIKFFTMYYYYVIIESFGFTSKF
jgi:hypothetical protein